MIILETNDYMYPMAFDDTFGNDKAYLNRNTVMDDEAWQEFIDDLTEIREQIVRREA